MIIRSDIQDHTNDHPPLEKQQLKENETIALDKSQRFQAVWQNGPGKGGKQVTPYASKQMRVTLVARAALHVRANVGTICISMRSVEEVRHQKFRVRQTAFT